MILDSVDELMSALKKREERKYVWGVGFYGKMLGYVIDSNELEWDGYFDNFVLEDNTLSKPILSPDNIKSNAFYILSMSAWHAVYDQLSKAGVGAESIACLSENVFKEIERLNGYTSEMEKKIYDLKDIYSGQSCFIVGNGPSLRISDLDKIQNQNIKSFGCNGIWSVFGKTKWRPNFYFMSDVFAIRTHVGNESLLSVLKEECDGVFLRCGLETNKLLKDNIYLFNQIYSSDDKDISFSNNCEKLVYIGYTVTYVMIQMAIYMGFSTIYLLGIDHFYSTEINNGIIELKDCEDHATFLNEGKDVYDIYHTTKAYQSAKQYADDNGITIINATRGGKLEVFARENFDLII